MKIPEIIRRYPSGKWIPGPETLTGLTVRTVLSICLSPGGGGRESWAGVSMLKGRRARVVGNGSNWEAGGCVRILSASTGKEDEESVYRACNHA